MILRKACSDRHQPTNQTISRHDWPSANSTSDRDISPVTSPLVTFSKRSFFAVDLIASVFHTKPQFPLFLPTPMLMRVPTRFARAPPAAAVLHRLPPHTGDLPGGATFAVAGCTTFLIATSCMNETIRQPF
jgi:hypothetical protein